MRFRPGTSALVALMLLGTSCSDRGIVDPSSPLLPRIARDGSFPDVRISEIHYDNGGTDAGEAIEISGPAGTDLGGWSLVLYNGNGGAPYDTDPLSGVIPDLCDGRGVVVLSYPVNGIQNGSPDGVALVDASSTVVEFLSYEGTFAAVGGPADGMTSADIGVAEMGAEPLGLSLQRTGVNTWNAPAAHTFGACNDEPPPPVDVTSVVVTPATATLVEGGGVQFTAEAFDAAGDPAVVAIAWTSTEPTIVSVNGVGLAVALQAGDAMVIGAAPNGVADTAAVHVVSLPTTRFSELHYDNSGTDAGEAIEIEGPAGTDLTGWSVVLYNGNGGLSYDTDPLSGVIPDLCSGRGVVVISYPSNGIQNGSPDGMALVDANGSVIEFLSYEGVFTAANGPASGMLSSDIGVLQTGSEPLGASLQRRADGSWRTSTTNSFGSCNVDPPPPPPGNTITFSGRLASDPPLPVGFQDQLFATLRVDNVVTPTTFAWTSETPLVASIDDNGVFTALAAGTAVLRATAANGTTATFALPTRVATLGGTAQYAGNAEFGEPADGDASDDFILRHLQFTSSYNRNRGTPNWVSYNLDASHFGAEDRCDCFTFDPALPADFPRYTTADYTGAGTFHGFGIDRGHLARSFDRTTGSLDNAFTFYFSNIIPQAADNNQGPWAALENFLGDQARNLNKEVYIVAGVAGSLTTVKGEGKIVIPTHVWKVALIMPRDLGLDDVDSHDDVEVIAVIVPNTAGIRNVDWQTYKTTVDAVEALSGYDLLALLADPIETAVESGTHPPVAATDGPYASTEGASVSMSGAASSDADGDALTYAWSFGDGGTATGATVSHTYAQDGLYAVRLIVTDVLGLADTIATTATVSNVAPSIAAFAGATLLPGETYAASGSFTDPGADSWTATVDYGDGAGESVLALNGTSFSLSHTYAAAGTLTVTVRVSDDDVTSSRTQTVTVLTPTQGLQIVSGMVSALAAGGALSQGNANALIAKLNAATASLAAGDSTTALDELGAFLNQLNALVLSGHLSAAAAAPLEALVIRVRASIS